MTRNPCRHDLGRVNVDQNATQGALSAAWSAIMSAPEGTDRAGDSMLLEVRTSANGGIRAARLVRFEDGWREIGCCARCGEQHQPFDLGLLPLGFTCERCSDC